MLYKSQALSFIEYRTPAIYHACSTILERVDKLQRRFLREIGVSETEALLQHSLAPLRARRDMAMLGVIHRTVLGLGPPHFQHFFRRRGGGQRHLTRLDCRRHSRQLVDPRDGSHSMLLTRSAFGLISVYNLLPQCIVDESSVKGFQSALQSMLKAKAWTGLGNWEELFCPRGAMYCHSLLR